MAGDTRCLDRGAPSTPALSLTSSVRPGLTGTERAAGAPRAQPHLALFLLDPLHLRPQAAQGGWEVRQGPAVRPTASLLPAPPGRAPACTHPLTPLCGKEKERGQGSSFLHRLLSPSAPLRGAQPPRERARGAPLPAPHLSPPAAPSAARLDWPWPPPPHPAPRGASRSQSGGARPRAPGPAAGRAPPAACAAPAAAAPGGDAGHRWGREAAGATVPEQDTPLPQPALALRCSGRRVRVVDTTPKQSKATTKVRTAATEPRGTEWTSRFS